jgi:putative PIG3 family NAD(P)H quinone oxidoreductase
VQFVIMSPKNQRCIVITAPGGPDVLQTISSPVPNPQAHEVLIEIKASGVNRHDCNQRRAGPGHASNPIPGLEVSGRIIEVGANMSETRLNEEVVALTDGGGYAEYVTTPSVLAHPKPPGFNWMEAAALPEALFAIWLNIFELSALRPGERVLLHGGTSGVGTLAIQCLTALGHDVYVTCGTDEKCKAALAIGASAAFNYHAADLAKQVRAATGGSGINVILDMSAGAHFAADLEMLATGGRVAHLSAGGGKQLSVPLHALMSKQIHISGSLLRPLPVDRKVDIARHLLKNVWPLLGKHVKPIIAAVFPLEHAAEAHREMEKNAHIGKIMLTV